MPRGAADSARTMLRVEDYSKEELERKKEEEDSDTEWEETGDCSEVGSVRPQVESRTDSMIDEYPDISGEATLRSCHFLSNSVHFY